MCARSPEKKATQPVQELQSRHHLGSAEMLHLDVTNDDTIKSAASRIQRNHSKLDILVNNAATSGLQDAPLRQRLQDSFDTNATSPAVVTEAFAPLLKLSPAPRIVNVSSGAGSLARQLDPSSPIYNVQEVQYRASKATLHMVTACQLVEYAPAGFKVFLYGPGFTVSNLGPHNSAENGAKLTEEAVRPLMYVLEGKRDGEAGKLLHNTGVWPW